MKIVTAFITLFLCLSTYASPSKDEVLKRWENTLKRDNSTLNLSKVSENKYLYKSTYFNFDDTLEILEIHLRELPHYDDVTHEGIIEVYLHGMNEDSVKKYGISYSNWRMFNSFYYSSTKKEWLTYNDFIEHNTALNTHYQEQNKKSIDEYIPLIMFILIGIMTFTFFRFMTSLKSLLESNNMYLRQIRNHLLEEKDEKRSSD